MNEKAQYIIVIYLLTAVAYLPLGILYLLSGLSFYIIYYIVRYRRETVRHNLELVFGTSDRKKLQETEKEFYRHMCDCIAETVKLLHISDKEVDRRVEVTNGEYIDGIIRSGHSVVLFLGHYGNWEWVQAIIRHFKAPLVGGQIYKPLHSRLMDMVMLKIRSRFGLECIPQDKAVRRLLGIERDGKKWVSFRIVSRDGKLSRGYELPVERVAAIKRHGAESIQRYTVLLTFRIGHLTLEREFTLADRSRFEYPVLLGRNVINGLAAVDPSRRNVL